MKHAPTSDKEIASVWLQQSLGELISKLEQDEDVDTDDELSVYGELRVIADKNLRDSRLDKIISRIEERLEKMLVPIDRYLANKDV